MDRLEYAVGRFRLRPHRQLLDDGAAVPIGRKALDILSVLAAADGALVTKDELMAAVWPNVTVEDNAIQVHIAALRRVLGQEAGLLGTVHGLGYRLTATKAAGAPSMDAPAPPPSEPSIAGPVEPLLAVLAFDNLSSDPEMNYFCDGVSEEIQQTVARGAGLKVIGRTSSFQFRGPDKTLRKVVADLKATHILDGSLRRYGSRIRISAQLIECALETTLWSQSYDRDLTDIFALQDEIAMSVAAALKTALANSPPPAPIDPAVFDIFLRAQAPQGFGFEAEKKQLNMFEEVVARAPAFARGWAAVASCRAFMLWQYRDATTAAGITHDQAVEAAETALRFDPQMGRAYQALAALEPWAAHRAREGLHDKALAAAPNDAEVLGRAAWFFSTVGRLREALALARRAHGLDPLAPAATNTLGVVLDGAGLTEEAGHVFDAARARWPESETFAGNAMVNAARRGDRARVESLIRVWSAAAGGNAPLQTSIWFARNLVEIEPASIRRMLEEQRGELARTGTVQLVGPLFLARLGLTEEAFELLDKASFTRLFDREGSPLSGTLFTGAIFNPSYRAFFADPRFSRLCGKLGLCDYWVETGKWPDCVDEVPYDFRAEARRLVGEGRAGVDSPAKRGANVTQLRSALGRNAPFA